MPETLDIPTLPAPPAEFAEPYPPRFEPAAAMPGWIQAVFLEETSNLHNADHRHLEHATLGVLWTNVEYVKKGKRVLGEARLGKPSGSNAWAKGRQEQQLRAWFDRVPDFLITLDALYVADRLQEDDGPAVLALIEHELYHCAQKTDKHGMPAFSKKTGRPKWTIRPHDLEEFAGIARRYGAATPDMRAFADALDEGPAMAEATIRGVCACGTQVAA